MVEPASAQNILKCYGQEMSLQICDPGLLHCHSLGTMELHFSKDVLPVLLGFLGANTKERCTLTGSIQLISFLKKDPTLACMSEQTEQVEYFHCQI